MPYGERKSFMQMMLPHCTMPWSPSITTGEELRCLHVTAVFTYCQNCSINRVCSPLYRSQGSFRPLSSRFKAEVANKCTVLRGDLPQNPVLQNHFRALPIS
jgi:hypothetical protein